jgi:asparagine synthase (glutamine-hydrolysing)
MLTRMGASIRHRGPDASGTWWSRDLQTGLVHRRLSIIDTSPAGAQPMSSACERWVIAFNGEIYDYRRLRHELDRLRHVPWRGHSDTEVALEWIAHAGFAAAIRRFSGMYAIAAVDRLEGVLWLASDGAGKKPLYYGKVGDVFAFGSELKALAQVGTMPPVDRVSAGLMMQYGYVPHPRSIYEGISKLAPGTLGRIDLRRGDLECAIETHWQPPAGRPAVGSGRVLGPERASQELERILAEAVGRRLVADVPIGALLSGGVDSSVVVALAVRAGHAGIRTFSIGFDDPRLDESSHALAVARALGTRHVARRIGESEMLEIVPDLPVIFDEPFSDSSQIPTLLVSRVARDEVTVALSGDGADELFGGYERYRAALRAWRLLDRFPTTVRTVGGGLLHAVAPVLDAVDRGSGLSSRLPRGSFRHALRNPRSLAAFVATPDFPSLYSRMMRTWSDPPVGGCAGDASADPVLGHASAFESLGARAWMMDTDFRTYLPGDVLTKVDRASMAASLEVRCPLLDEEVVRFAYELPDEDRIGHGGEHLKPLLKGIARRLVPPEVIDRPKMGFGVPLAAWLRGPLRDWARDLLSEDTVARHGILDGARVRASFDSLERGSDGESGRVWAACSLSAWLEHGRAGRR